MIRIAAAYPRQEGKSFDMEYYLHTQLPMVWKKFSPYGLRKIEVDQGIERPGGGSSPFFAIGYLYFDSLADFQECYAKAGQEVVGNISNYSQVAPLIQVGQVEGIK